MKNGIRFAVFMIPIIFVIASYWPTLHFFSNQYDDSYITYRYAINFAEGNGLVFNLGERTDSASSFLYTLALAAAWILGFKNLEIVGALLGLASLGFVCLYVYKLALHLSTNRAASILVAITCGINGFLSGWTLSGMETLPWTASVLIAIYLMTTGARNELIVMAIGIAALIRFEGIFLSLPYALFLIKKSEIALKDLALLAAPVLLSIVFYTIKYEYYSVWISHAFKMKEIAEYYQPAPRELLRHWLTFGSIPFFLSIFGLLQRTHTPLLAYLAISILSLTMGPKSDWSRYSVHLLPIFYSFSSIALNKIQLLPNKKLKKILPLIIASLLLAQAARGHAFNWRNMTDLARHQTCRKALGVYIAANIPRNEYIASSDLGIISYAAINHRFVDLIALTSADVLRSYAQAQNADHILNDKRVRYIADTFPSTEKNRFNTLLAQFPLVHEKSSFNISKENPIFTCSANGKLEFKLANINKETQNDTK